MAITKTQTDLIGTSGGRVTVTHGTSVTSSALDLSTTIGLVISAQVSYGATAPASQPQVDILTSPDNTNFDSEAFGTEYVPAANATIKQQAIAVGPEIKYAEVKVTNSDATYDIDVWVSSVKMTN